MDEINTFSGTREEVLNWLYSLHIIANGDFAIVKGHDRNVVQCTKVNPERVLGGTLALLDVSTLPNVMS